MIKSAKNSKEYEPTLSDILESVQTGFQKVDERFEKVDEQFAKIDGQFEELGYRVTALEKRTGAIEITLEDMRETLNGVARAVDKDALTIIDHKRRIVHLEKASI